MFGDNMILGLVASTEALGNYYFAFSLSLQTVQLLMTTMHSALFPALSKLVGDPVRQVQAHLRATRATSLVTCYGCGLQAILCGPLLRLVFGSKWNEAIPIIYMLSAAMSIYAMFGSTWALFQAQGRFRTQLISISCHTLGLLTAVAVGAVFWQGFGAGVGWFASAALSYPVLCYVGIRYGNGTWGDVLRLAVYPILMLLVVFSIPMAWELASAPTRLGDIVFVVLTTPITLIAYGLLARWLAPEPWNEIKVRLGSLLTRLAPSSVLISRFQRRISA
jgi:O-antigen/teichoic acid export membrane protein